MKNEDSEMYFAPVIREKRSRVLIRMSSPSGSGREASSAADGQPQFRFISQVKL